MRAGQRASSESNMNVAADDRRHAAVLRDLCFSQGASSRHGFTKSGLEGSSRRSLQSSRMQWRAHNSPVKLEPYSQ
jgi:hypothetical protein